MEEQQVRKYKSHVYKPNKVHRWCIIRNVDGKEIKYYIWADQKMLDEELELLHYDCSFMLASLDK